MSATVSWTGETEKFDDSDWSGRIPAQLVLLALLVSPWDITLLLPPARPTDRDGFCKQWCIEITIQLKTNVIK